MDNGRLLSARRNFRVLTSSRAFQAAQRRHGQRIYFRFYDFNRTPYLRVIYTPIRSEFTRRQMRYTRINFMLE